MLLKFWMPAFAGMTKNIQPPAHSFTIMENAFAYAPGEKPGSGNIPHSFGVTIILEDKG